MSYNGGINFGLLADYDAIDDVEEIAAGIEASIAELAEAAEAVEAEGKQPDTSGVRA
jgi:diacylglycerol O-acyltransferase